MFRGRHLERAVPRLPSARSGRMDTYRSTRTAVRAMTANCAGLGVAVVPYTVDERGPERKNGNEIETALTWRLFI
jgi:hypothetical protein